ncbi:hypothetical protein PPL_02015 [Heterostelium album PN500]|uniref:Transmembrane protein n=1 Tax=Heterostelium pallidum (strain ATCC 26659 / Pp 5 / PN500) TaxID=670386 RepID=D3B145_HETP5|nr:hypothetical protein PPL_02015 [Heterostelium album PN500]EFA85019.1 hypothetical protein PPL_02015 [Heterostelium album PN500]|eukprot:XP_020437129.1 hypothetical protein PPL_02015 [Heterostelium album PN500]
MSSHSFNQTIILFIIVSAFVVMVNGQARPPPVVTQQLVIAPFSSSVTITGVDLGGTGSDIKILLGSTKTVCSSKSVGQLSFLSQNTSIVCQNFMYDMNCLNTLQALDVTITVDGTSHVSNQMLIYTQSSTSCITGPYNNGCNTGDTCSYGICQCGTNQVGPLCNLDQVYSTYSSSSVQPKFKYIYQNGLLEWNIVFNKLNVWDAATSQYVLLKDLTTDVTWTQVVSGTDTLIYTSSAIDTVANVGSVKVTMKFANSLFTQTIGDYSTYLQPRSMQFKVQILNLPNSYTKTYQVGFQISTNYTNSCDTQTVAYSNHLYNNANTDNRWFFFTKNSVSLYGRYPSRCLQDDAPIVQTCSLDLLEDAVQQNIGNGQYVISYPKFNTNSQTFFDLLIVNYTNYPSYPPPVCTESIPSAHPAPWLLPSIIPLISLCLASFLVVLLLIFKENKKTLQYGFLHDFEEVEDPLIDIKVEKETKPVDHFEINQQAQTYFTNNY